MSLPEFDVTQPGAGLNLVAAGDGVADDTAAIQERLDMIAWRNQPPPAGGGEGGGSIYFPPGAYRITETLHIRDYYPLTIRGDGYMSHLLWGKEHPKEPDFDLFVWDAGSTGAHIHDFKVTAQHDMDSHTTAFRCTTSYNNENAASDFSLSRVKIDVADPHSMRWGSGVRLAAPGEDPEPSVGGSVYLSDLQFWRYKGTAIELKDVTDVRIRGCRFPSLGHFWSFPKLPPDKPVPLVLVKPAPGSIGIHLAGNTGGVSVENCDLSEIDTCILLERTGKRKWNRELFLSGGACDASNHGLVIRDDTFVTVTGAWLASCTSENLLVEAGHNPRMEITGGIVFNAGSLRKQKVQPYRHHGLVIHGGQFAMSGVMVNNNAGYGLFVGDGVEGYAVNGCTFIDNWVLGAVFGGSCGTIVGNAFTGNGTIPSQQIWVRGTQLTFESNRICT